MNIDIFKKYTPEETCALIGCDMKTLLPILEKMGKKKRTGIKQKGDVWFIPGGEVRAIKYGLEQK